jgi:ABC-type transporter MlaC component
MIIKNIVKSCLFVFLSLTQIFSNDNNFSQADEKETLAYLQGFLKEAYDAAQNSLKDSNAKSKFADIIINNFSLEDMAPPILGPYRTKLSTEQRKEFEKKLTNYFLKTYGTTEKIKLFASTKMDNKQIKPTPQIISKNTRMVYNATFKTSSGDVSAKFVLLKKGKNVFKVGDIQIAGIGLVVGTRDQIATLHKNQTVSGDAFLAAFESFIKN